MNSSDRPIRVLYSFPHKLGADRICYTAWQQVRGLHSAGADLLVYPGALARPVPDGVRTKPTLALGKFRVPYRLLGTMRALAIHDHIVARRVRKLGGKIDIIHTWPDAALETLKVASAMGIPTVLERPNAHTRFAYNAVQQEAKRIGIVLPPTDEYYFHEDILRKEEKEYDLTDYLLCASEFSKRTFLDQGFPAEKLLRHQYGYDETAYYPDPNRSSPSGGGLTMLFAGEAAVRKGVHVALEAWLNSPAHREGTFFIAGRFLPAYADKLSAMLAHPSVRVLGHRNDLPDLMRKADLFVLPSVEEGFGLVCVEAMGSGAVPLVSEACTDLCQHMENALVHPIGDVKTLTEQITLLHENRELLQRLRTSCIKTAPSCTWTAAGVRLLNVYRDVLQSRQKKQPTEIEMGKIRLHC